MVTKVYHLSAFVGVQSLVAGLAQLPVPDQRRDDPHPTGGGPALLGRRPMAEPRVSLWLIRLAALLRIV